MYDDAEAGRAFRAIENEVKDVLGNILELEEIVLFMFSARENGHATILSRKEDVAERTNAPVKRNWFSVKEAAVRRSG